MKYLSLLFLGWAFEPLFNSGGWRVTEKWWQREGGGGMQQGPGVRVELWLAAALAESSYTWDARSTRATLMWNIRLYSMTEKDALKRKRETTFNTKVDPKLFELYINEMYTSHDMLHWALLFFTLMSHPACYELLPASSSDFLVLQVLAATPRSGIGWCPQQTVLLLLLVISLFEIYSLCKMYSFSLPQSPSTGSQTGGTRRNLCNVFEWNKSRNIQFSYDLKCAVEIVNGGQTNGSAKAKYQEVMGGSFTPK